MPETMNVFCHKCTNRKTIKDVFLSRHNDSSQLRNIVKYGTLNNHEDGHKEYSKSKRI